MSGIAIVIDDGEKRVSIETVPIFPDFQYSLRVLDNIYLLSEDGRPLFHGRSTTFEDAAEQLQAGLQIQPTEHKKKYRKVLYAHRLEIRKLLITEYENEIPNCMFTFFDSLERFEKFMKEARFLEVQTS